MLAEAQTEGAFAAARYEAFVPSALGEGGVALRQRFQRDGYLYLPGVVPRAETQALLGDFLDDRSTTAQLGLLAAAAFRLGDEGKRGDEAWALLRDVWDVTGEVTTRTVDTHVKRLREKLGDAAEYIETIRGVGYRFRDAPPA